MRRLYVPQLRKLVRNNQKLENFVNGPSIVKAVIIRQSPVKSSHRLLSSSPTLPNCIGTLKPIAINHTSDPLKIEEPLFNEVMTLIKTNRFHKIISTLKLSKIQLTNSQLLAIIKELSKAKKHNQILSIFALYKKEIIKDIHLLELILTAAYNQDNHSLFEDLFTYYMQFADPSAKPFNLALRMFLKTNTEFAKQILYQMIYSQYPMNERTLFDFLTVADKVSTFQTIKFAVELIKRSPHVPVSPAAYGELTKSYLRDGTGHDVNMLFEFLKERNVHELYEVKIAFFLKGIHGRSMPEIWVEFAELRELISPKPELLSKFYTNFYHEVHSKLNSEDLNRLIEYLKRDNIFLSSRSQQHIIYQIKDEYSLFEYINKLRVQGMRIDKYIIRTVWSRLVNSNHDHAYAITLAFNKLASQNSQKFPWIDELPKMFKLWQGNHSRDKKYSPFTLSNSDYWIHDQVNLFISREEDGNVIKLLNDLLREGKKPSMQILSYMLKGLIGLKSSEDHKVYQLIHELYGNPPSSVDLVWLSKTVRDVKGKKCSWLISGNALQDFELKHHGNLTYQDYLHLSSLAIDARRFDLSMDFLNKSRNLIPQEDIGERRHVYILFLKTLTMKMDPVNFISMVKLMISEEGVYPSSYTLRRTVQYKKSLMENEKLEKELKEQLDQEFGTLYPALRAKFVEKKVGLQENLEKIITSLEEWMNETLERK